jgi:hypothetical protein
MKITLIILSIITTLPALSAQFETGKYVGKELESGKKCFISIDLDGERAYAESRRAKYLLVKAFQTTPDVDCPGEHIRYVGFQINGKEDKEIEICISLDNEINQVYFENIESGDTEKVCVDMKKIHE